MTTKPIVTTVPVPGSQDQVTITMNARAAELLAELIEQHHATKLVPLAASHASAAAPRQETTTENGTVIARH